MHLPKTNMTTKYEILMGTKILEAVNLTLFGQ